MSTSEKSQIKGRTAYMDLGLNLLAEQLNVMGYWSVRLIKVNE